MRHIYHLIESNRNWKQSVISYVCRVANITGEFERVEILWTMCDICMRSRQYSCMITRTYGINKYEEMISMDNSLNIIREVYKDIIKNKLMD